MKAIAVVIHPTASKAEFEKLEADMRGLGDMDVIMGASAVASEPALQRYPEDFRSPALLSYHISKGEFTNKRELDQSFERTKPILLANFNKGRLPREVLPKFKFTLVPRDNNSVFCMCVWENVCPKDFLAFIKVMDQTFRKEGDLKIDSDHTTLKSWWQFWK